MAEPDSTTAALGPPHTFFTGWSDEEDDDAYFGAGRGQECRSQEDGSHELIRDDTDWQGNNPFETYMSDDGEVTDASGVSTTVCPRLRRDPVSVGVANMQRAMAYIAYEYFRNGLQAATDEGRLNGPHFTADLSQLNGVAGDHVVLSLAALAFEAMVTVAMNNKDLRSFCSTWGGGYDGPIENDVICSYGALLPELLVGDPEEFVDAFMLPFVEDFCGSRMAFWDSYWPLAMRTKERGLADAAGAEIGLRNPLRKMGMQAEAVEGVLGKALVIDAAKLLVSVDFLNAYVEHSKPRPNSDNMAGSFCDMDHDHSLALSDHAWFFLGSNQQRVDDNDDM